jgi:MOSC domain-containing protein YiiM
MNMLNSKSSLASLFAAPVRPGKITWIGLRPARRTPPAVVDTALAVPGQGLEGDRYASRNGGKRQVTLIQAEHLAAIASYLGVERIDPALLRRNIVTQGINLLALKGKRFRIGAAVFAYSGECHPCSRMEEHLGTGGYNAVRGHGGITAQVLEGGEIHTGDAIAALSLME